MNEQTELFSVEGQSFILLNRKVAVLKNEYYLNALARLCDVSDLSLRSLDEIVSTRTVVKSKSELLAQGYVIETPTVETTIWPERRKSICPRIKVPAPRNPNAKPSRVLAVIEL